MPLGAETLRYATVLLLLFLLLLLLLSSSLLLLLLLLLLHAPVLRKAYNIRRSIIMWELSMLDDDSIKVVG